MGTKRMDFDRLNSLIRMAAGNCRSGTILLQPSKGLQSTLIASWLTAEGTSVIARNRHSWPDSCTLIYSGDGGQRIL